MGTDVIHQDRKASLRRESIEARRGISREFRRRHSGTIVEKCRSLREFGQTDPVCSFIGFGEEVETADLLLRRLRTGGRIAVPTLRLEGGEPAFSEVFSWEHLTANALGILEPAPEHLHRLPADSIPLFFVPGTAFDSTGGRLGYGIGFYDRALAGASQDALLVGLCFDLQLVGSVPVEEHDLFMDMIITEKRVIEAPRRRGQRRRCTESC